MRKFVQGMMATCIIAVGLTGCGGKVKDNQISSGEDSNKPLSFRIATTSFGMTPTDTLIQKEWERICEEKMGRELDIKWEYINMNDYKEKQKVILAGGDLPDILTFFQLPNSDIMKYGEQGLLEELTQNLDKLPNYKQIVEADEYAPSKIYSEDGKSYAFYNAQYIPDGNQGILAAGAVRMDLLRECGINEVPATLDELYEAGKALKEKYPEKYPMIIHEEWQQIENTVATAYHTNTGRYYNGKQYVYGPLEDNYKKTLMYMSKLYKEGLISPDYITHTSEQGQATVANGEAMIIPSIWDGYVANWVKQYPDQEWVLIPNISEKKGDHSWEFYSGKSSEWSLNPTYSVAVSSKSKVKDEMLQLMDIQYSPEIIELLTWGVEGETFEVKADGTKEFVQKYIDDTELLVGIGHPTSGKNRSGIFPQPQNFYISNREFTYPGRVFDGKEIVESRTYDYVVENANESNTSPIYDVIAPVLSADENEEYASVMTAVETYVKEQKIKFIKGERSFDEWDKYIQEVNKIGDIQGALDIYNSKLK